MSIRSIPSIEQYYSEKPLVTIFKMMEGYSHRNYKSNRVIINAVLVPTKTEHTYANPNKANINNKLFLRNLMAHQCLVDSHSSIDQIRGK